jgi:hypothetical protein
MLMFADGMEVHAIATNGGSPRNRFVHLLRGEGVDEAEPGRIAVGIFRAQELTCLIGTTSRWTGYGFGEPPPTVESGASILVTIDAAPRTSSFTALSLALMRVVGPDILKAAIGR